MRIAPCNALTASLIVFRDHELADARELAFWSAASILWNDGRETPLCERHEWADLIIKDCVHNKYTAVGGAAGAGKSYVLAAWAIVSWLCAPADTMVLVTSTTLTAARGRIYGAITRLLDAVEGLPIKLRDSIGSAAYVSPEGTLIETAGIRLIAAEKKNTRDAVGKLIGFHCPRLILIADELTELSIAIIEAALSNMSRNPHFELRAASNPASRFDAFGDWCTPKDGWDSLDVLNDYEWVTKYGGLFRRLDAERSPNLQYDYVRYPYLPSQEDIDKAKENMGPTSSGYMRMFRAVFATSDELDVLYSEMELNRSGALSRVSLQGKPERAAAMDPAFTNGGDSTTLIIGEIGYDESGQFVMQPVEVIALHDDATDKSTPRSFQIAKQVKDICVKRKIDPSNFAMDATGAGSPLADVIAAEWAPDFLRVQFGGKASDKPVSASKRTPASHLFVNRVSELWGSGKELIRCRQLRGIPSEVASDMCGRTYDSVKSEHGLRIRVEPKSDFKLRHGRSPDAADAFFVLLELARERFGMLAMEPVKDSDGLAALRRHRSVKHLDAVQHSPHAQLLD